MTPTHPRGWPALAQIAAVVLAGLSSAACAGDLTVADGATGHACSAPSDCGNGLTCSVGYCVAAGPNELTVRARIVVPPSSTAVSQQIPELDLSRGDSVTVSLVEPVVLYGVVANKGDAFVSNLAGEIEARSAGDLPWLQHRFTARSFDGLDDSGRGYALGLLPGRDYDVTFRPDDDSIPPHTFTLLADEVVAGKHNIQLPAKEDYVALGVHLRLGEDQPIPGARLTVLMPDGKALPTVTVDTAQGVAAIKLPPGTEEVRVRVEAPADGVIFPEFTSAPFAPSEGVKISVPPLPAGMVEFDAQLRVLTSPDTTDGEREPVAGVSLALVGHLEGGTLRRSAITDADGMARFQALPGAYDVLVSVPNGTPWGSTVAKLNLTAGTRDGAAAPEASGNGGADASADGEEASAGDSPTPTIVLPRRPWLSGKVLDSGGLTVGAGIIVARRRVQATADGGPVLAPSPLELPIAADGTFAAPMDAGTWDVSIRPAASTGAPTDTVSGITLTDDESFEFHLREPGVAHLTIVDAAGLPQSNVTVELFLAGDDNDPLVLAKGTTFADGSVALLIPHVVAD